MHMRCGQKPGSHDLRPELRGSFNVTDSEDHVAQLFYLDWSGLGGGGDSFGPLLSYRFSL